MKGKKTVIKILSVLLILGAFFFITEIFQEKERASFTVDSEKFDVAKTEKELKEKLNQSVTMYNPEKLELIDEYKLMTEIKNVEVDIIEERRNFRIESIWNEEIGLLVTYSLDMNPFDKEPEEIPYLKVDRLSYHMDGKEPIEFAVDNRRNPDSSYSSYKGVVFENRLYRRVWLYPEMNEQSFKEFWTWLGNQESIGYRPDGLTNIKKFGLEEIELIEKTETEERTIAMEDLSIDYNFKSWNPVLETIPINKTVKLGTDTEITYHNFEKRLDFSQLNFELNSPHEFSELNYKSNNIEYSPIQTELDGEQFIRIHNTPWEQQSDNFVIEILGGIIQTDEEVNFTITNEDLNDFKNGLKEGLETYELNRELGEVNEINFVLKGLEKNNQWIDEYQHGFLLSTETDKDYNRLHFSNYTEMKKRLEEYPEAYQHMNTQAFYEVFDQDGNPVLSQSGYSKGTYTENKKYAQVIYYGLHNDKFEKLEELNIRFFQIPKEFKFEENKIKIELNK